MDSIIAPVASINLPPIVAASKTTRNLYRQYPIATSREFRERMLKRFPALRYHRHAVIYWRILQYILFSTFVDEATGKIVLSRNIMAELVGVHPKTRGFSAWRWMEAFSRDVFPLNASDYIYRRGQARIIDPAIDAEIQEALRLERQHTDIQEKVWFVEGTPKSRRSAREVTHEHEQKLREQSGAVEKNHPAYPLLQYLLMQPQDCLQKVVKANWPAVRDAMSALSVETDRERRTREWCERVLFAVQGHYSMFYTDVPGTARIFTVGATVHQLPRELRHIAFSGQVEMDLRACQLAVVARIWDIPALQVFLDSGASIWTELLGHIGMAEDYKPIVKRTVYSILFGMGKKNLRQQLTHGDGRSVGVGEVAASRFFQHPIIEALLKARSRQQEMVWRQNGCHDGFGRWRSTKWDGVRKKKNCLSVLAAVVQSYELRLMMAILPVLQAEPQVYLLSWLHDGVTLHFGNHTKMERQIRKLQQAVEHETNALGISTRLEVEQLPLPQSTPTLFPRTSETGALIPRTC